MALGQTKNYLNLTFFERGKVKKAVPDLHNGEAFKQIDKISEKRFSVGPAEIIPKTFDNFEMVACRSQFGHRKFHHSAD